MKKNSKVYIKLFLSAFFWGGSAIASKFLLREVQPAVATFLRFFISTIILMFAFRLVAKEIRLSLTEHINLFLLGFVGVTLCYYCFFTGLFLSTAFNAALLAVILRKEAFSAARFAGFVIAYSGIVIIISQMKLENLLSLRFNTGDILLLLSTVFFGIYNVMYKHFSFKIPSNLQTYYIFLYGSLALIPWLLFSTGGTKEFHNIKLSLSGVLSIIFLSFGSSVLAYLFFNNGIKALGASKASGFINYVPLVSIFLTIIILKEKVTMYQAIGSAIVLAGVFISYRMENKLSMLQSGN